MKNLIIIVVGAIALIASLFACQKSQSAKTESNACENNVITEISVDSLQGNLIPVQVDWNERILTLFVADDHTCELLIGYQTPKYSSFANVAHRKVVLVGKLGYWDKKAPSVFVFDNGKRAKLVPAYPANSTAPMPKQPRTDKPLRAVEELPLRTK